MKIERDYTQPFFRQPPRRRIRKLLLAVLIAALLGAGVYWQWQSIVEAVESLGAPPPTPTPLPGQRASRAARLVIDNDLLAAEAELAIAVSERPRNSAYLFAHGMLLVELARYDEALALGRAITDIDARDARGFALQATALTWQGQPADAIPIALSALQSHPRFTALHAALTRAYVDSGRWTDALDTAERGLSVQSR